MGSIHSELVGDELHIARTDVSTGDPNGVVTPGIIGEFYWDSDANKLYIAESLLNTSWVHSGSEFDEFIELLDTPNSYSGQAGFVTQVNVGETGLEFGQALRLTDTPQFASLILQIVSGSTNLALNDSLGAQQLVIQINEGPDQALFQSVIDLLIQSSTDIEINAVLGKVSISAQDELFVNTVLTLQPPTGDANFLIKDSSSVLKFNIQYNSTLDVIDIQSQVGLLLRSVVGGLAINTDSGDLILTSPTGEVRISAGVNFFVNTDDIFVDSSTGFVGLGSATPLAQLFVSSLLSDTVPVSMQESLGSNGARIKTLVGDRDPEGLVTGDPGDHYWRKSGTDSSLFIKRTAGSSNTGWDTVFDAEAFNEFIELLDTPSSYSGQAGNSLQVTLAEDGIEFGQPLDIQNDPTFNDLTLTEGLELLNTAAPVLSSVLFDAGNIASGQSIFILGEYAYFVVADFDRLLILDVSDPTATPVIIGNFVDSVNMGSPRFIFVIATLAYIVSNNSNSLSIVDVSDSTTPFIVGQISDAVLLDDPTSVYVVGKFAYVTAQTSDALVIIDISNPKTPEIVGSLVDSVNLERASEVVVLDKFAYVVSFSSKSLSIIDISNSTNPTLTGVLIDVVNLNGASSLTVNGGFAYIAAAASDMLTIVDITDPSNPTLAGTLVDAVNLNGARGITVAGKFAYISSGVGSSLTVIDISDPTNPVLTSVLFDSVNLPGARMPFISGKFAYVPAFNSFSIIDIHGIDASTASLGNIQSTNISTTRDAFIKGNLFAGALNVGDRGIHSDGDISNKGSIDIIPTMPVLNRALINIPNIVSGEKVYVVGQYAYMVASGTDNLLILDISENGFPADTPTIIGSLVDAVNLNSPRSVFVAGNFAYVASFDSDSLSIIDVSIPSSPVLVGQLSSASLLDGANDVYVVGKFAYVTAFNSDSLVIVDISDPNNPTITGSLVDNSALDGATAVVVSGDFAYVVSFNNPSSLATIDISDPTSPSLITSFNIFQQMNAIAIDGRFAYITFLIGVFAIVDISNPSAPIITKFLSDTTNLLGANGVSIAGNFAYISLSNLDAVVLLEIFDGAVAPRIVETLIDSTNLDQAASIFISGETAFIPGLNSLALVDLGGLEVTTANIGNLETNQLHVIGDAIVRGNSYTGGLNVGDRGIHSDGDISNKGSISSAPSPPIINRTLIDGTNINSGIKVYVVGQYAYMVSQGQDRLLILDISENGFPADTPTIIGNLLDGTNLDFPQSVFVAGNFAYVVSSVSNSLSIINVADPTTPFLAGQLSDSLLNGASDVVVVGKYAYVTASLANSFVVVDISSNGNPVIVGSIVDGTNLSQAKSVVVSGNFAYVVGNDDPGRFAVINISDPTLPSINGTLTLAGNANALSVDGRFAYVTFNTGRFAIIDISDPASPAIVTQLIDTTNLLGVNGVSIAGNFAYLSSSFLDAVIILQLFDGATVPKIVETLSDSTNLDQATGIYISGETAFVPGFSSLAMVDLGGLEVTTANIGNLETNQLHVIGDEIVRGNLYVGALNVGDRGIHSDGDISAKGALDVVPSQPKLVGSLTDGTDLNGANWIAIVNNYAYVISTTGNSLTILDITEPTNPLKVSTLSGAVNFPNPQTVFVSGKFAYMTSFDNDSLVVIDVSDVFNPTFIGSVVDAGDLNGARSNYVAGKFCYVVSQNSNSFTVVDISDPVNPVVVGSVSDNVDLLTAQQLYVLGKFAYVGLALNRLTILDISEPASPIIVGSLNSASFMNGITDVYVVGRYAYVTAQLSDSLAIVDVSDPTNPTITGSVLDSVLLDSPQALSVDGNYAYVAASDVSDRITIIDISDPTNPVIIQSFQPGLGFLLNNIFVSGKYAYVVSGDSDKFGVIDLNGIDASTASIGNIKTGYLSVDNEIVAKGITYSGGFNAGPHGVHSDGDISGLSLFATFDKGDEVAIERIKNTGSNPGRSEKFVGNRDPNAFVSGLGGDVYFRGDGNTSGTYESRNVISGTEWFKRSVKPVNIVEINNLAEFEELATAGVITVTTNLTLIFNRNIVSATEFVLAGGNLNITAADQASSGIIYTGSGTLFSGNGDLRISGGVNISSTTGTLLALTDGSVNINSAIFSDWVNLGSFSSGTFVLTSVSFISCSIGFNLVNPILISVSDIAHSGTPMLNSFFTVNSNNPETSMVFTKVGSVTDASIFDFNTRLVNTRAIIIGGSFVSNAIGGTIFKQTTSATAPINGVANASLAAGTITQFADNGAGGTTVSSTTVYVDDELVTISATTNYNGSFQVFNVVAGVSFDIIEPFVGDDATGTTNSERINLSLTGGPLPIALGTSIKVTETNFYNAFYTVIITGLNFVIVNATFISTNTGIVEVDVSLDETDPRINAKANSTIADSNFLACGFVNDNSTANGAIVNNTFTDMVFGIVGTALVASSTMARWRLINELNASFENINLEPFDGFLAFDFTVESAGGTVDFRYKWVIDRGSGFVDLPDPVEVLVNVGSDAQNVTKVYPLKAELGDIIKPQITRNSGTSGITTRYATMNASE